MRAAAASPGYRPKCVSGGLVVRLPFDPCAELVPVDAGAVSCGDAERLVLALRAPFPCLPVEALESFIGHRVGREPCVGLGMRRVLMAVCVQLVVAGLVTMIFRV